MLPVDDAAVHTLLLKGHNDQRKQMYSMGYNWKYTNCTVDFQALSNCRNSANYFVITTKLIEVGESFFLAAFSCTSTKRALSI